MQRHPPGLHLSRVGTRSAGGCVHGDTLVWAHYCSWLHDLQCVTEVEWWVRAWVGWWGGCGGSAGDGCCCRVDGMDPLLGGAAECLHRCRVPTPCIRLLGDPQPPSRHLRNLIAMLLCINHPRAAPPCLPRRWRRCCRSQRRAAAAGAFMRARAQRWRGHWQPAATGAHAWLTWRRGWCRCGCESVQDE